MRLFRGLQRRATEKEDGARSPELIAGLEQIRAARFPHVERDRFAAIWCAVAEIIGIDPLLLRAEDRVIELCPNSRWPSFNGKIQDLEALVLDKSRDRAPPSKTMETIGDIVDYLS
jgi:hypothetical protein